MHHVVSLLASIAAQSPRITLDPVAEETVILGAFQRAKSAIDEGAARERGLVTRRRATGGPAITAGPGTLRLALSLPRHDALVPCGPRQIVNRYVRPLLRGLTRAGATAHYFGRDWVSVAKRPVAFIGMAHHGATGATLVEAFIAVSRDFALPTALDAYPTRERDALREKSPTTLSGATGRDFDEALIREAVRSAYDEAYGAPIERSKRSFEDDCPEVNDDRPAWDALIEDAIGFVGASASPLSLGGDFMGSIDTVRAIEEALGQVLQSGEPSTQAFQYAIDSALEGSPGAIEGLADRTSIARAIENARARSITRAQR